MAIASQKIRAFASGVHNRFDDEIIEQDALSDAQGWITRDGTIELARGRVLHGDIGTAGYCDKLHVGYKTDGTSVYFKKSGTKVQALVNDVWTDVITGLTEGALISFANYTSLAGNFVYVFSTDGIWKIVTANPTDNADLYDEAKNFKGIAIIDKGRSILWGREQDKTGLYGSKIDPQDSTVYTSVSGEALANVATGTLAFKSGGSTRTCFAVTITVTTSGQVFTDNFDGTLTGDAGGTGTINYMTGAFTTDDTGAGTVDYQWEDSNDGGLTDFTESSPRVAGDGFIFPQDIGGDAIQKVIPIDGEYFSLKKRNVYRLSLSDDDLDATNEVFRTNIGMPSSESAVATSKGILFIDTSVTDTPRIRYITRNVAGDNFDVAPVFEHFDFSKYTYDTAVMDIYGDYMVLACRTSDATANNIILLCNYQDNTVDILPYEARSFVQDNGVLYTGDSLSQSVYKTLNGFDDLGNLIENYAETKAESYGSDDLKKVKRLRLKGFISPGQSYSVYGSFDGDGYTKLGNIDSAAGYVDQGQGITVGATMVGTQPIGGEGSTVAYPYYAELKVKTPKFRTRKLKLEAEGYGFISVESIDDYDIWIYEGKMPKRNRQKQNVDINDGSATNQANPNY